MAVWFELEKSDPGIRNFLDSNWSFHDFRYEKIEYIPGKDSVEIFLKYDTMTEGVLLRFKEVHGIHIDAPMDYDTDWLMGSTVLLFEDDSIIWIDDDGWDIHDREQLDEVKKRTTWVEAGRILWAITDADGNPVEMPLNRINQIWNIWGKTEEKYFDLKVFDGDVDDF